MTTPPPLADYETTVGASAHVETMYLKGDLTPDCYHKCVVTLASQFLCRHHDPEMCLILLNRCPPDYYTDIIVQQMREDYPFACSTFELGYRLVQFGFLDLNADPPNVPRGDA